MGEIVDLYAGPGGWSEALRILGRSADELGVEYDNAACATRAAAGHRTLQADIGDLDHLQFADLEGLIASPPCQGFSSAGKGAARNLIPDLLASIRARRWNDRADPDPRVWLIVNLGRWLEDLNFRWVALEQVPSVLPIWQAYAELLRSRRYSVWTGILNAADFGVPQTRQRAILIASKDRIVHPPEPTHDRNPVPSLFGTLEPWISMFTALGWGMTDRAGYTFAPGTKGGGASVVGGSGARRGLDGERAAGRWVDTRGDSGRESDTFDPEEQPSRTITGKSDSWRIRTGMNPDDDRDPAEPAPTVTTRADQWKLRAGKAKNATVRDESEPAPTLAFGHDMASWNFELVARRDSEGWIEQEGPRRNRTSLEESDDGGDTAIRVTIRDALILQSFRPDYPVQGTKTKQFEQIGNAIPPRLAEHVLRSVLP